MTGHPSPRPGEPDLHVTFRLHGIRFDFAACLTAALNFIADWPNHHKEPITVGSAETSGLIRLPGECLYLDPCPAPARGDTTVDRWHTANGRSAPGTLTRPTAGIDQGGRTMEADYGRSEVAAFKQAASAGEIKFDPEVVTDVVKRYDNLISTLQDQLAQIAEVRDVSGMGGFASGQQLAAGFSNKAVQFQDVLVQFIEGAMRMQEAFLIAGGRLEEADQKNAAAVQAAALLSGGEQ